MLTLHFAGNELGEIYSLQTSQDGSTLRWRAMLEFDAATQESAAQALDALEAKLAGDGTLEVRHGGAAVRKLNIGACATGPRLARKTVVESDSAEAHPSKVATLEFEASLATEPPPQTSGSPTQTSESIATSAKRRVVDLPLLAPNMPPWRQEIGGPTFEVTQEGETVSAGDFADPAAPLSQADLIERRVSYLREAGRFTTRWRYVMRPLSYVKAARP